MRRSMISGYALRAARVTLSDNQMSASKGSVQIVFMSHPFLSGTYL